MKDAADIEEPITRFSFTLEHEKLHKNFQPTPQNGERETPKACNLLQSKGKPYQVQHTDHELILARNASFAAMQGSASESNFRYYPT
jgi:hypothetical protein